MTAKTFHITSVCRVTASEESDSLALKPGVNVIVGEKGTGKSAWLKTISYLLGDTDPPEEAMKQEIAEKFDSATMQLIVGGEEATIQRRWKETGVKTAIFFNGEMVKKDDFSLFCLTKLNIPAVRFPKGSPYSGSTWPHLSWRMLFRHIYRQERFWSDLADKQYPKEQHACVLQFLGAADKIYPNELSEEIDQHKKLLNLQARKEQFEDVLQQAARDIIADPAISNSPTLDAIDQGMTRLREEIEHLRHRREAILAKVIAGQFRERPELADAELGERRVRLAANREEAKERFSQLEHRQSELTGYREQVQAELNRLRRVETAGDFFSGLKVTCCPACDQKVTPATAESGRCYLCHQAVGETVGQIGAKKRVEFEIDQLAGEETELTELLERLQQEKQETQHHVRRLDDELTEVEALLRPMRAAVAAVLPPEVALLDTQVGQSEERIAQLNRLRRAVEHRDDLSRQIDSLRGSIQGLSDRVDSKTATIPFEQLSDAVSDGINEYLNILKAGDTSRWLHDLIRFNLSEASIRIRVGTKSWSSLGETDVGYVLLGYHYALLKLSGHDGYNYPGLGLIDFPMNFADKTSVADKENYLIEPFVTLAKSNPNFQLVVCGRSFKNLEGAHRIELSKVWKQKEQEDAVVANEAADRKEEGS